MRKLSNDSIEPNATLDTEKRIGYWAIVGGLLVVVLVGGLAVFGFVLWLVLEYGD